MIFAAGFGTRMGDLTADRPKPLIPVAGRTLLDHALAPAQAADLHPVVVNTHYKGAQIAAHLDGTDVTVLDEAPDILETGGGLRNAVPFLGADPVFTMNSDAVWAGPNPYDILEAAWRPDNMDALLLCVPASRALGHPGRDFVLAPDGRLSRGAGYAYCGVQILKTNGLADIPDAAFSVSRLWDLAAKAGRLFGISYPGQWCDVGQPENISLAESMLEDADV